MNEWKTWMKDSREFRLSAVIGDISWESGRERGSAGSRAWLN